MRKCKEETCLSLACMIRSKWLMQTWMPVASCHLEGGHEIPPLQSQVAAEFFLFKCDLGHLLLKIWRPPLHKSLKQTFQRQSLQVSLGVVRSCMKCFPQQICHPRSVKLQAWTPQLGFRPMNTWLENLEICTSKPTSSTNSFNSNPHSPFRPASLVSGWNWNSLGSAPAMAIWQRIQLTKTQEMIRFSATPLSYKYELPQLADFFLPDLPLGSKYLPYCRLAANQQTKLWQIDTNCRSEHPCQHCIRPSHHRLRHPRVTAWARYLNYKQNRKGWQFQPHQRRFTKKGSTTQPGLQHSEDLRRLRLCGLSANPQHCNTSRYLIDSLTPDCIDVLWNLTHVSFKQVLVTPLPEVFPDLQGTLYVFTYFRASSSSESNPSMLYHTGKLGSRAVETCPWEDKGRVFVLEYIFNRSWHESCHWSHDYISHDYMKRLWNCTKSTFHSHMNCKSCHS